MLYVATAVTEGDPDLARRVRIHRERRPETWGTLEVGDIDEVVGSAALWEAVLFDSLTLWVSARLFVDGEAATLEAFDRFLKGVGGLPTPFVLVGDEVGLGVVPESESGRAFRDALGLVNQRAAAVAEEAYLCVAGIGVRIK